MRRGSVLAFVLASALTAAAEESGFKSSGRYDAALQIRLGMDPAVALIGQKTIVAEITGAKATSVKFYVDGELAGSDESEPYETRFDFGPTPRHREIVIVALTAAGAKNKRIFSTDANGMLDPAITTAAPPAPDAGDASAASDARPASSDRAGAPRSAAGDGRSAGTSVISVALLEPFGDVVTGKSSIVVDARARKPHSVARVEIYVDGALVTTLKAAPYETTFDFGSDPRPREVKAIAYGEAGDAVSALWKSEGAAPASAARELSVKFVTPKEGDYLAGPVTLQVDVAGAAPARVDFFVDGSLVGSADKEPWEVKWEAGTKVLAHQVKAYAYDRNGGRAAATVSTKPLDVAIVEEVREVVLNASFTDRQGRPIADLKQEEIAVKEDGKEQEITGFKPELRPITLALVIDASGSMEQKLADTKIAAASFVDQLTPDDRAIVIAFSAEVQVLCKATADKAKLKSAIQSIQVQTSTALYDALALSIDELKAAAGPDGRKAIVILSDGEDSGGGKNTYEAVEKAAITADVRVYSIDITRTSTATNIKALGGSPFAQVSSTTLRGLSDQTGGDAYYVAALIELKDSYAKVADDLRRQYWITYRPSNTKKDGKWREVGVEGKERKLLVKTRAGYYAPTH